MPEYPGMSKKDIELLNKYSDAKGLWKSDTPPAIKNRLIQKMRKGERTAVELMSGKRTPRRRS